MADEDERLTLSGTLTPPPAQPDAAPPSLFDSFTAALPPGLSDFLPVTEPEPEPWYLSVP